MDGSDGGNGKIGGHQRMDIRVGVERRRKWSRDDRLRIVQETLADGAVVAEIARRNEVASSLIYTWRKQAFAGLLDGFHQVRIVPDVEAELPMLASPAPTDTSATAAKTPLAEPEQSRRTIEVTLPDGTTLRVDGDAEHGALRTILASLGRRS